MNSIQLHDKKFIPYISAEKIQQRILELCAQINAELKNEKPLFLPVLNGSFMFAADLMKHVTIPCEISFVKIASYQGTTSTGNVKTLIGLDVPVKDRLVIIVEDIVDTGKTLTEFLPVLRGYMPREIKIATLLSKPEALVSPMKLDYVGFEVPNKFLVGYGLDYDGLGRNLNDIYQLEE